MKVWHLALAGVLAIGAFNIGYSATRTTTTITVNEKERVQQCSSDSCTSRYLIFADSEVFENTDNLFYGKFNSSDIYGRLQQGKTYEVEVVGWRVPILSAHRNILTAQEATP